MKKIWGVSNMGITKANSAMSSQSCIASRVAEPRRTTALAQQCRMVRAGARRRERKIPPTWRLTRLPQQLLMTRLQGGQVWCKPFWPSSKEKVGIRENLRTSGGTEKAHLVGPGRVAGKVMVEEELAVSREAATAKEVAVGKTGAQRRGSVGATSAEGITV